LGICPRGRLTLGGFLGGHLDDFIDGLDFDELLRIIDDPTDPSEDFDELDEFVEHIDNQRW
jgi:hypothetical protein